MQERSSMDSVTKWHRGQSEHRNKQAAAALSQAAEAFR
jgi:hypothetical protein